MDSAERALQVHKPGEPRAGTGSRLEAFGRVAACAHQDACLVEGADVVTLEDRQESVCQRVLHPGGSRSCPRDYGREVVSIGSHAAYRSPERLRQRTESRPIEIEGETLHSRCEPRQNPMPDLFRRSLLFVWVRARQRGQTRRLGLEVPRRSEAPARPEQLAPHAQRHQQPPRRDPQIVEWRPSLQVARPAHRLVPRLEPARAVTLDPARERQGRDTRHASPSDPRSSAGPPPASRSAAIRLDR